MMTDAEAFKIRDMMVRHALRAQAKHAELPEEQEPGQGGPPVPAESPQTLVEWMDWAIRRHLERQANQEPAPEPAPEPPVSWVDQIITLLDRKQEEGAEPEQTPADTEPAG